MQILQFPDSSWGLTVLKNIFLRFIGLKGLKMVWKKSSLIWNFFPWFWLKTPCFSLISLTGKSLQNFPWIPWFPWSVGTLKHGSVQHKTMVLLSPCINKTMVLYAYWPVLGAPTLDEAHPYRAHARQLVDRLEALVDALRQERRELLVVEDLQVTACGERTINQRECNTDYTLWTETEKPIRECFTPCRENNQSGSMYKYRLHHVERDQPTREHV